MNCLTERKSQSQSLVSGALILVVSTVVVKIIGAVYKIPLTGIIGASGRGYFSTAYNIYIPLYSMSMAGLPIAVSKLVSENRALGRTENVKKIFSISLKIFIMTGLLGTAALIICAYPYASEIAKMADAVPCIFVIAPSIFFGCAASAYRGYYEGMNNMKPTAVSQVIEAVLKLLMGIGCAYAIMWYGMEKYEMNGELMGKIVSSSEEAAELIAPYAAAGAVSGVTVGSAVGLIYLILYRRSQRKHELRTPPSGCACLSNSCIKKSLFRIAVPVVIGSLIGNVTNLIDAATIQNRLFEAVQSGRSVIESIYPLSITPQMSDDTVSAFLYGCYNSALDFKNLVPAVTQTLGISAIPIIAGAWSMKNIRRTKATAESVIRITMLVALPAGFGMSVLAEPIINVIYGASQPDIVPVSYPILSTYGWAVGLMAVSGPVISMLQAIGRTDVPIKSMIVGGILKLASNYVLVGMPEYNIRGAAVGSVLCYTFIAIYNIFALCKAAHIKLNFVSVFLKPLFASVMSCSAAWSAYGLLSQYISGAAPLLIAVLAAVIVYAVSILLIRGIVADDVRAIGKGKNIVKVLEKYNLIG